MVKRIKRSFKPHTPENQIRSLRAFIGPQKLEEGSEEFLGIIFPP